MSHKPVRAIVYARLSLADRRPDGTLDTESVDRQERRCRDWCAANGAVVVEVITDNDVSASGLRFVGPTGKVGGVSPSATTYLKRNTQPRSSIGRGTRHAVRVADA